MDRYGSRPSGGGNGGDMASDPKAWALGCGGMLFAFLALWFLIGIRSVDAGHIGVVKTGGSISGVIDPGYNHIWVPFQSFDEIDLRTQKQPFAEIDASSQELQTVKVTGTLTYHIDKAHAVDLYQHVGLDNIVGSVIQPALQDYLKEATPKFQTVDLLQHRGEIRANTLQALNQRLHQQYPGIVVDDLFLANMGFSQQYENAIEMKQAAAQQVLTAQQQQDKAKIDAGTRVIEAQGQADANSRLQQSLTPGVLESKAIEKWNGQMPQVSGPGGTPFINLNPAK
jgi:regulator of protease activity HflC (stomatin/prohibitin superfamily)